MTWNAAAGLDGAVVLVTGAARGIGRAVAEAFAAAGTTVCALDLDAAVDDVVAGLDGHGHEALRVDLRDVTTHSDVIGGIVERHGRLDHLAHLAAVLRRRSDIDEITEEDWDFQVDVNLKASFFLLRAAARAIAENSGGGSMTAFTSQGWMTGGFGGSVVYAATKGGIVSMTRGMARTYATRGVRVNTVSPGGVDTPMMVGGLTDEALAGFVAGIPLGRLAEPEELAGSVVFLASDHARYITGATLNVSGGFLMY
jgi:NAD(P)-dependent dehydrogenase (short-subunit alcohol dehydrogenase family)